MPKIMDILGQIESLAYSLAVWIILIPKTIIKILLDSGWVRGYVDKEFSESKEKRFDDYVSPVILLLLCSLIPYVGYQLLPPFGLLDLNGEYVHGSKTCTVGQSCAYAIEGNYFSDFYTVDWQFTGAPEESQELVAQQDQDSAPTRLAEKVEHTWTTEGQKQIAVTVKDGDTVISNASLDVTVNPKGQGAEAVNPPEESLWTKLSDSGLKTDIAGALQKNNYLGILFLVPALIFALAAYGVRGKHLSADSLKEVVYAQCYYFTPFSLFSYLWLYSLYFLTDDLDGIFLLSTLALLGVFIWFVIAEINAVAQEPVFQGAKARSKTSAFWIVALTGGTILFVGTLIWILIFNPDWLRAAGYRAFELGVWALVIYSVARPIKKWWDKRKGKKTIVPGPGIDPNVSEPS